MSDLADLARMRGLLDQLAMTGSGKRASANYFNRRRAVLYNALKYAVTLGHLESNPLDDTALGWENRADWIPTMSSTPASSATPAKSKRCSLPSPMSAAPEARSWWRSTPACTTP
ncbi:hypothetical protein GCM10029992_35990 [Glycomyces albus]